MNGDTILHRQINPSWLQQGRVTSQAFKPTTKDNKRLSVYDGDQITAKGSWDHYTKELGYASVGVLGVTVEECNTQDLLVEPDPEPFPSHIVIQFGDCTNSQIEVKAKRLRELAARRGWQYEFGIEL